LLRHRESDRALALGVVFIFSAALAFRILLKMTPSEYAIYYNGPAALSFLVLACAMVPRSGRSRRFVFVGETLVCLGCLAAVVSASPKLDLKAAHYVPLITDRGKIIVDEKVAENYGAAIPFMKQAASRGEYVLSVPEDTSLYFLAGVECPTRVFAFTPGVVSPGKMTDELIREMEQKPVRYLLWSNRMFTEYGVVGFGIDFDKAFGDYLRSHYHRVGFLLPNGTDMWRLNFVVWEKNASA
jgi:hypothetical protein